MRKAFPIGNGVTATTMSAIWRHDARRDGILAGMEFAIQVDLSPVIDGLQEVVNGTVLPQLRQAVWAVAQQAQIDWMTAIGHAKLWSGEKDNYSSSIDIQETGPFSALVSSDYKFAEQIETGRPAYDLKFMLRTSSKTRMGKNGQKYLIIPFRHNVGSMPAAVAFAAKRLDPSRVTGMGTRISATGATVAQAKYAWGGRLKPNAVPGMLRKHTGMVRFDVSTKGAPRSSYLTFRVMSENSTGWIIPAQPGQNIVKGVVEETAAARREGICGGAAAGSCLAAEQIEAPGDQPLWQPRAHVFHPIRRIVHEDEEFLRPRARYRVRRSRRRAAAIGPCEVAQLIESRERALDSRCIARIQPKHPGYRNDRYQQPVIGTGEQVHRELLDGVLGQQAIKLPCVIDRAVLRNAQYRVALLVLPELRPALLNLLRCHAGDRRRRRRPEPSAAEADSAVGVCRARIWIDIRAPIGFRPHELLADIAPQEPVERRRVEPHQESRREISGPLSAQSKRLASGAGCASSHRPPPAYRMSTPSIAM